MRVSYATFTWWLPLCKTSLISICYFHISVDLIDQRILQSDWTRGKPGHTQLKLVVSDSAFLWWLFPCKNLWYRLTFSWDTDHQRVLQSDWTRGTTGRTQLEVIVSDPIFPWWISPCKKSNISIDSFQR